VKMENMRKRGGRGKEKNGKRETVKEKNNF
jgi:hypothetical protein